MVCGAQSIYCVSRPHVIEHLTRRGIPVFCHAGLVPQICTGAGGLRAVGKTRVEADRICQSVADFVDAGAVGVYLHLIPEKLAGAITAAAGLTTVSVGAGRDCDVIWAHADDVLGCNTGHVPRHARSFCNIGAPEASECFRRYSRNVELGLYPGAEHTIKSVLPVWPDQLWPD
ncbi:MAG: hypothetical protein GJ676_11485 [Rhodobacteraceae bacterium]|nr:hypothetical protein [Paracoccaceae bacterium]